MRFMYKRDIHTDAQYIVVSANSETFDYSTCRKIRLTSHTVEEMQLEIRRVFFLGPHDEVLLQYEGEWNSEVVDGKVRHPFLADTLVKVPVSR